MSAAEYVPTTAEIREYVEVGGEPRPWIAPSDEEDAKDAARAAAFDRWLEAHEAKFFTADDIRQMVEDTTDRQGNLYRIDFLNRVEHEERLRAEPEPSDSEGSADV